eukprot:766237-Hanusia_phi.AAC.1
MITSILWHPGGEGVERVSSMWIGSEKFVLSAKRNMITVLRVRGGSEETIEGITREDLERRKAAKRKKKKKKKKEERFFRVEHGESKRKRIPPIAKLKRFREDPRSLKVVAKQEGESRPIGETLRRKFPSGSVKGVKQQRNWKKKKLCEARTERWKKRIIARARKDLHNLPWRSHRDNPHGKVPTLCGMPLQDEFSDLEEIRFNFSRTRGKGQALRDVEVSDEKEASRSALPTNLSCLISPKQTKRSPWLEKYEKKMQEREAAKSEKEKKRRDIEARKAQAKDRRNKWRRKLNAKTSRGQPVMHYHILRILKQAQQDSKSPAAAAPAAAAPPPAND